MRQARPTLQVRRADLEDACRRGMSDEGAHRLRLAAAQMAARFYELTHPITEADIARLVEAAIRVGWDAREAVDHGAPVAVRSLTEVDHG